MSEEGELEGSNPNAHGNRQQELRDRLDSVIDNFSTEWNVTYYDIIGVLNTMALDMNAEARRVHGGDEA
jgi:hypothetical protein